MLPSWTEFSGCSQSMMHAVNSCTIRKVLTGLQSDEIVTYDQKSQWSRCDEKQSKTHYCVAQIFFWLVLND